MLKCSIISIVVKLYYNPMLIQEGQFSRAINTGLSSIKKNQVMYPSAITSLNRWFIAITSLLLDNLTSKGFLRYLTLKNDKVFHHYHQMTVTVCVCDVKIMMRKRCAGKTVNTCLVNISRNVILYHAFLILAIVERNTCVNVYRLHAFLCKYRLPEDGKMDSDCSAM